MGLLEIGGVTKRFGSLVAVDDVTFEVQEGEIFGIAGPNGAGKSVLFSTISGFYRPSAGRIDFAGRNIVGLAPNQVCHLGLTRTFQTPTLFHSMTVEENIRIGGLFGRGDHADDLPELIEFLELGPVATRRATNLDLFTTKKVVLGAALATDPRLLMLDEPMAGFSHVEIERYLDLIQKIRERRTITVIVIEHLLDVLTGVSDRMLVMHYGEVLHQGLPHDVVSDQRVVDVYLGSGIEV